MLFSHWSKLYSSFDHFRNWRKLLCYSRNFYEYIIFLAILVYFGYLIFAAPINFDEAYNLQVPLSIIRGEGYNTIYRIGKFDGFTIITTGPTVLLPVSASFAAFGVGKIQARLVTSFYLLSLFILVLWISKRELGSGLYGILFALFFYSMLQLELSFWVLGEIPALFFLLLGSTTLVYGSQRYTNLAFIIMGLSVITKFYFLFSLLPILVTFFWYKKLPSGYQDLLPKLINSAFCFLLPLFLFEFIKLILLGIPRYKKYLLEFIKFAVSQNLPPDAISYSSHYNNFALAKLMTFSKSVFPSMPVEATWVIVTITIILCSIFTIQRRNLLVSLYFLTFVEYLTWFILFDALGWWRRIYPFSILFLFVFLHAVSVVLSALKTYFQKVLLVFVGIALTTSWIIPSTISQYRHTLGYHKSSLAQQEFANVVKSYMDNGYNIAVYGWWQAPEISFLLGGIRFHKISCEKKDQEKTLVIFTKLQESFSPQEATYLKQCLNQLIQASPDQQYFLYSLRQK